MIVGVVLALLFAFSSAQAHEIRPAYLELTETAPGQFSIVWRTPVMSGMRLPIDLKGRTWVRFEVWDIAANGAFTQPVWLAGGRAN